MLGIFTAQAVKMEAVRCNAFAVSPVRLESAQRVREFTKLLINCSFTGALIKGLSYEIFFKNKFFMDITVLLEVQRRPLPFPGQAGQEVPLPATHERRVRT